MTKIKPQDFFSACIQGNYEIAARFIEEKQYPIDIRSEEGWTGLIMSCFNENTELSKLLIRNGADINATNDKGTTIFMYAKTPIQRKQTNTSFLQYLLDKGANINALDQNKKSVLDYVLDNNALLLAEWLIQKGAKRGQDIFE